jgi:protein TonB
VPIPKHRVDPPYSEKACLAKLSGTTVLWIVVGLQGEVEEAVVEKPLGLGLDENALRAVRTWTFEPATRNGTPIRARVMVEISFRLF